MYKDIISYKLANDEFKQWAVVCSNMEDEQGADYLVSVVSSEETCNAAIDEISTFFPNAVIDMREPSESFKCVDLDGRGYDLLRQLIERRDLSNSGGLKIKEILVPDEKRLSFLPSKLGNSCVAFENIVYNLAREYCKDYDGGLWRFQELTNGGFYIWPDEGCAYDVLNWSNQWSGALTAKAFGVGLSLMALSRLTQIENCPSSVYHIYHQLRDFMIEHPASGDLFGFTD